MELKIGEGRVYGARYYTVDPNFNWDPGWYNQPWNDLLAWCVREYGPGPTNVVTPGAKWYANNSKFWFREKEDLAYFILCWGR